MLIEKPNIFSSKNVPTKEIGIVTNGISVAFILLKKRKTIRRTKRIASKIVDFTFFKDCLTKSALSETTVNFTPFGQTTFYSS